MSDPKDNLVLIGYRGCGKTTVGRLVAEIAGLPFVDTDQLITEQAGMSIARLFETEGEQGFRRREAEVIGQVADFGPSIISAGGGAVLSEDNMQRLKTRGHIVWLTCPALVLHERISLDESSAASRPALSDARGIDEVRSILADREPLYRRWADVEFSSHDRPVQSVAEAVCNWYQDRRGGD